jgi:hypothetical protein
MYISHQDYATLMIALGFTEEEMKARAAKAIDEGKLWFVSIGAERFDIILYTGGTNGQGG